MADENADAVEECCQMLGLSTAADKQLIATALKVCLAKKHHGIFNVRNGTLTSFFLES